MGIKANEAMVLKIVPLAVSLASWPYMPANMGASEPTGMASITTAIPG